jgi:hypothetical protein
MINQLKALISGRNNTSLNHGGNPETMPVALSRKLAADLR